MGALAAAHCGAACTGTGVAGAAQCRRSHRGLAGPARACRAGQTATDRQGAVACAWRCARGARCQHRAGGSGVGAGRMQAGDWRAGRVSGGVPARLHGADQRAGPGVFAGAGAAHLAGDARLQARRQAVRRDAARTGADPGEAVALYGTVALVGTPWASYHEIRAPNTHHHDSTGSSCGGGGDGGDGGGGDSGGDGGGGCGGCGGGGD